MLTRTIEQGECAESVAAECKTPLDKLWDHPDNQALKALRKSPNVLLPGDELSVPREPGTLELKANQVNRFVVKGQTTRLKLVLTDAVQQPLKQLNFKLTLGELEISGTTGEAGEIDEAIPATATSALLFMEGSDEAVELLIGSLDPVTELSGVQARLENLGFDPGPVDGIMGPLTQAAILAFRQRSDLPESEDVDDELRSKLLEAHGI